MYVTVWALEINPTDQISLHIFVSKVVGAPELEPSMGPFTYTSWIYNCSKQRRIEAADMGFMT